MNKDREDIGTECDHEDPNSFTQNPCAIFPLTTLLLMFTKFDSSENIGLAEDLIQQMAQS